VPSLEQTYRPLLEAVSFAARAHQGQLRKDQKTPYASHVFRASLILRHVFGIEDAATLTAAVLHDTIEDTTTDFDDVKERFGPEVAGWVATLSKDKRLEDAPREKAYMAGLASAPWQVKVCKLADIFDNLMDSGHLSGQSRQRTLARSRAYLGALDSPALPPAVGRAFEIVQALVREVEANDN
jgi:guanosine-3',5'-bis(diphosphate) 3'-pyrophosphohydrolase